MNTNFNKKLISLVLAGVLTSGVAFSSSDLAKMPGMVVTQQQEKNLKDLQFMARNCLFDLMWAKGFLDKESNENDVWSQTNDVVVRFACLARSYDGFFSRVTKLGSKKDNGSQISGVLECLNQLQQSYKFFAEKNIKLSNTFLDLECNSPCEAFNKLKEEAKELVIANKLLVKEIIEAVGLNFQETKAEVETKLLTFKYSGITGSINL